MKTFTSEMQKNTTPAQALSLLKEGNKRFVEQSMVTRDYLAQSSETSNGQYPFAVVLSCIDSRVSSEIIFDQGIGDIFSVRVAGNVINEDVLGSMEFGCKAAGSKLIVVLGHSKCGAVKGACDHVEMGNLTALLNKIQPAVEEEKTITGDRSSKNADFVSRVTDINVKKSVIEILEKSPIIKEMVESGECALVGGVHDITSGEVHFFD